MYPPFNSSRRRAVIAAIIQVPRSGNGFCGDRCALRRTVGRAASDKAGEKGNFSGGTPQIEKEGVHRVSEEMTLQLGHVYDTPHDEVVVRRKGLI